MLLSDREPGLAADMEPADPPAWSIGALPAPSVEPICGAAIGSCRDATNDLASCAACAQPGGPMLTPMRPLRSSRFSSSRVSRWPCRRP